MSEEKKKTVPVALDTEPVESTAGVLRFLAPGTTEWQDLTTDGALQNANGDLEEAETAKRKVVESQDRVRDFLNASLQIPNLIVLAGSGTSLGSSVGGPSMWDLWDYAVFEDPGNRSRKKFVEKKDVVAVLKAVGFDPKTHGQNIEALLSQCEAFLQFQKIKAVEDFVSECRKLILEMCSGFLRTADGKSWDYEKLTAHRTFLHRLSKRRTRDPRLKIFTTNYDLCFELAASLQDLIVLDGFSAFRPRRFSPSFFDYDIVRRPPGKSDVGDYLEGVFFLLKLHGSVSWERSSDDVVEVESPSPDDACLIYPARGKYQQSFLQPHLELLSQYLNSLRQPNTCVLITGFGFNDDHLSEPIYAAIKTNPQLRIIIADMKCEDHLTRPTAHTSQYWKKFAELAASGSNIWFVNSAFGEFASLLPDLGSLSPGEQLERVIKRLK